MNLNLTVRGMGIVNIIMYTIFFKYETKNNNIFYNKKG